jgi:alkylation response protein AidB-like acyl-CoA dehydrogenase
MKPEPEFPTLQERIMLRDSVRGFLGAAWPAEQAVRRGADAAAISEVWGKLVGQGVASLGSDPGEGGLLEICIVMEELGRAACPAPMLGAALANLAAWPHADTARISFLCAPAEALALDGTNLSGTLAFVEGASSATHILVALDQGTVAVIDAAQQGVEILAARSMGADGLFQVCLEGVAVALFKTPPDLLADLALIGRLCLAARAHGAARRAFELAVDYAKERHQFGRAIGSFQAIQHKLADCLIQLDGVRRTIDNAAANHARGNADWRYYASAAIAYAHDSLRGVSLETQHVFGAIGYAEEHEAPRHFRRTHIDSLLGGSARDAREVLAAWLLDGESGALPIYDLGSDANALRADVRAWLVQHWSGSRKAVFDRRPYREREYDAGFARDLGATGWIGLSWPKHHGGQQRSLLEQLAFSEEMERAEVPRFFTPIQANAIMTYGTAQQQARYLPEMLRGEVMHGIGYSEPGSGSDLASLRTSAVRDGEEWVINGQKIWTTTYWGQYMFLAARTDQHARSPHSGISTFIVRLDTPGVTIRPSDTMYDGTFANIFYDDVRIPLDALVGQENGGWQVLTNALATERGLIGGGIVMKVAHLFELLCRYIRGAAVNGNPLAMDALVRDRVGRIAADIEVGRQLMMQCAELVCEGVTPPEYGAISKVFCSELLERFGEAALDIIGMPATLSQGAPGCIENGKFEQGLRHALMWVISMGTNEIQRSLIAQRALGLPR